MKHILILLVIIMSLSAQRLFNEVSFNSFSVGGKIDERCKLFGESEQFVFYSFPDTAWGYAGTSEVWTLKSDSTVCLISFVPSSPVDEGTMELIRGSLEDYHVDNVHFYDPFTEVQDVEPFRMEASFAGSTLIQVLGKDPKGFYTIGSLVILGRSLSETGINELRKLVNEGM